MTGYYTPEKLHLELLGRDRIPQLGFGQVVVDLGTLDCSRGSVGELDLLSVRIGEHGLCTRFAGEIALTALEEIVLG